MAIDEVLSAVTRSLSGAPAAADELRALWDDTAPPWERCLIAHYLADTVTDPAGALVWDRRALQAAEQIDPALPGPAGLSAESMLPSLHLNIAENHRLLGDNAAAAAHLESGRAQVWRLADTGYGGMIRAGLDRLADRLANSADQS